MIQVISRDGVVICVTTVPYPNWVIRDMKQNGYKIRNVEGFAKGTPLENRQGLFSYGGLDTTGISV